MKIIVAGGTGFIGKAMVRRYVGAGHHVTVLGRSVEKITTLFGDAVSALDWRTLGSQHLNKSDLIINLAGATIGEKRWSASRKREILESRIKPTTTLAKLCAELGKDSPALFNTSAVGTYGFQPSVADGLPEGLDEQTPVDFTTAPDFLSRVGRAWELATRPASEAGVRVVIMRFGVVLADDGGALAELTMPFHFFIGGPIGNGQQPFPWIARDDLLTAIDFVFEKKDISGPVNFVSPGCVTQKQLARAIGKSMHRPSVMPTPGFILKLIFGQMADELLLHGQHAIPGVLQDQGFTFHHPDIQSALGL